MDAFLSDVVLRAPVFGATFLTARKNDQALLLCSTGKARHGETTARVFEPSDPVRRALLV